MAERLFVGYRGIMEKRTVITYCLGRKADNALAYPSLLSRVWALCSEVSKHGVPVLCVPSNKSPW